MCRLLTVSLIIRPKGRRDWGNIAEQIIKLTIVSEFRQQVEAIEPDRLPRWLGVLFFTFPSYVWVKLLYCPLAQCGKSVSP